MVTAPTAPSVEFPTELPRAPHLGPCWQEGQALSYMLLEPRGAQSQRLWQPGQALQPPGPEGLAGRGWGGMSKAHMQQLEARGRKCSSPFGRSPHLQGNSCPEPHPDGFLAHRRPYPLLASSLLSDLDPAVTMELGSKALLETRRPAEATAAPDPTGPLCFHPVENRQGPPPGGQSWRGRSEWYLSCSLFPWLARLPI